MNFDAIRPFNPDELPEVYGRLLADPEFNAVLEKIMPGVPRAAVEAKLSEAKTNLDFQKAFCYPLLRKLIAEKSAGAAFDFSRLDTARRYTFVSNHRDIVLDSAFLSVGLIEADFRTTCEIAIGDNLLARPWIRDLVRVNKSFIVERGAAPREMLMSSKRLSEYMHHVIADKDDNIWIAQREGRAKDSDDRTQPSILKMMAMGGSGSVKERLIQLHIAPLAISYELDPCDGLKLAEYRARQADPEWHKTKADDVRSMATGIMGEKGHITYKAAECIDDFIASLPDDMPKNEIFPAVAAHIDRAIHSNYTIYPVNRAALEWLRPAEDCVCDGIDDADRSRFAARMEAAVEQAGPADDAERDALRRRFALMYANPLINHINAQQ